MENFRPRNYQIEMFEMSMRENIIAVVGPLFSNSEEILIGPTFTFLFQLPTGSGKTYMYDSLQFRSAHL